MAGDGVIFTREEARRTEAAVKHFERSQRGILAPALKKVRAAGGGGSACTEQYAIWFSGRPTGGTTSLPIDVDGTLESIVINWDAAGTAPDGYAGSSQAYIDTALATHSLISLDDITVTDPGGKLPHHVMRFYFTGDTAAQEISFGIQTDSFTGGSSPYSTLDKCCG